MSEKEPQTSPALGRRTAVFTKRPLPGRVKTRLCPPLQPEQAARLARAMLEDVVAQLGASPSFTTSIHFAPAGEREWFERHFQPPGGLHPQRGEGLALRLANHFEDELAAGGRSAVPGGRTAVVVGSDIPLISPAVVERAHTELEAGADLVLGPDLGGGYYLVGLRRSVPQLFTDVPMSTGDMCARTVELARGLGLTVALLEPGYDVDREQDLRRLRADLAAPAQLEQRGLCFPAQTARVLGELAP